MPPSPAAFKPFIHTITVLAVASAGSNTRSFTFRLPVHGVSKQVPAAGALVTLILSPTTPAGGPSAVVSRYRPRMESGGRVLPKGASPPIPITPPATPTRRVPGCDGCTRILLMLRPLKTGTL